MELEAEFDLSDEEIPEELNFPIFRVLQEALNNAAKHSRASRVKATLSKVDNSIRLEVSDNGVGFEPERELHSSKPGGFGLTSMKERAELFGGSFLISSQKGRGTAVITSWNLSRLK
jgi:signal transduction histidine kinase